MPNGAAPCLNSHAAWLLAAAPACAAERLLFNELAGRKTSKKGRMGPETFRVGYLLVSSGILILGAWASPGAPRANKTSNQTFGGSLVSWPRLPRFAHFPFHFPFRGEKGSDPRGRPKHGGRGGRHSEVLAAAAGKFLISLPKAKIQLTWPLEAKGGRG